MHPAIARHLPCIAAICKRLGVLRLAPLEQLRGRPVDLIEPCAVLNPYVLTSIYRHRESVYVAA